MLQKARARAGSACTQHKHNFAIGAMRKGLREDRMGVRSRLLHLNKKLATPTWKNEKKTDTVHKKNDSGISKGMLLSGNLIASALILSSENVWLRFLYL